MQGKPKKQIQAQSGPRWAFGAVLRAIRTESGMSQEELGFRTGLDRTFISLLERGVRSPTIVTIFKLAEVLDVAPSEMVHRMEALIAGSKDEKD
ncbi:MAG: helix-turn-helix transcriptional regulator [Bryobacteraceae bacterium]